MSYKSIPNATECDLNYTRYVGYAETTTGIEKYFSPQTINKISSKITELLQGVHPQGKRLIVPNTEICHILDAVYRNYRPVTGDIYSRYNIPNNNVNMLQDMIDQTIEIIVSQTKAEIGMQVANSKLSVWNTVLGDFNTHELRSHDVIKISKKHPMHQYFFENY